MRISVRAYGFKMYEEKLFRVSENVVRPQRAFLHAADFLMHITDMTFESQGRRGGGSWKRISEAWKARKEDLNLDPRILHATLRLRKSLTRRGHSEQVLIMNRKELKFGTSVPYAGRQNAVRPFLKLTSSDRRMLANEIVDEFVSPFHYGRRRRR